MWFRNGGENILSMQTIVCNHIEIKKIIRSNEIKYYEIYICKSCGKEMEVKEK